MQNNDFNKQQNAETKSLLITSSQISLKDVDVDNFLIEIKTDNRIKQINREKEAEIMPSLVETFQSSYCDRQVQIIVLKSEIRSGVFAGFLYSNLILNREDFSIIDELSGGEVIEKQTNKVESDSQKETLKKLKSDFKDPQFCKKLK